MSMLLIAALLLQDDVRQVSWWWNGVAKALGMNRDLLWYIVLTLNLLALVWILYKALFAGKGWSIPSALKQRGKSIRERMDEAEKAYQDASDSLQRAEARLAGLSQEIAVLEAKSKAEGEAELARLAEESRREAERIARTAQDEIAAATKNAQKELQTFAARLALDLAEVRIRERLTPALDRAVVQQAVKEMQN